MSGAPPHGVCRALALIAVLRVWMNGIGGYKAVLSKSFYEDRDYPPHEDFAALRGAAIPLESAETGDMTESSTSSVHPYPSFCSSSLQLEASSSL